MIDTLYKETILELNRHPLNKKVLAEFDVEAREFNPVCGDDVTVRMKFDQEACPAQPEGRRRGNILDIGWQGECCAISTAAVSLVTDEVKAHSALLRAGKDKALIAQMGLKEITDLLGGEIIATRAQCALLGLKAIQKALL